MASASMLVMNRNVTITTRTGHSLEFTKGEPTHVPPAAYQEVMAAGGVPPEGSEVLTQDKPVHQAPSDPAERNPIIAKAILEVVAANNREDFTAAGSPTVEAISKIAGFKVAGKEIGGMWQAYHDKLAAEKIEAEKSNAAEKPKEKAITGAENK